MPRINPAAQSGRYPGRVQVELADTDTLSGTFDWTVDGEGDGNGASKKYSLDVNKVPWDVKYSLDGIRVDIVPRQRISLTPDRSTSRRIGFSQIVNPHPESFVRCHCNGEGYQVPPDSVDITKLVHLNVGSGVETFSFRTSTEEDNQGQLSDDEWLDVGDSDEEGSPLGSENQHAGNHAFDDSEHSDDDVSQGIPAPASRETHVISSGNICTNGSMNLAFSGTLAELKAILDRRPGAAGEGAQRDA